MPALTLLEAAKLNDGTELTRSVIEIFARESDLIRVLPFMSISGNAIKYNREGSLPSVGFRAVNQAYATSSGTLDPVTDALAIFGGDIDVDKFIVDTMGGEQRTVQRAMKIKAMAAAFALKFIKGDTTSAREEFDGLQRRVTGNQVVHNSTASGGAALSLIKLDEALDACVGATHIVASRATRRRFTQAARNPSIAGNINMTTDEFGKPVVQYAGLPIVCPYDTARGSEILTFTEAYNGGGTATGTSMYVLRMDETGVHGIKNGEISVRDLGELQTAPVLRDRVEGYVGLSIPDPLAAVRLDSIQDAAITA
jgi:hypothetical protein